MIVTKERALGTAGRGGRIPEGAGENLQRKMGGPLRELLCPQSELAGASEAAERASEEGGRGRADREVERDR